LINLARRVVRTLQPRQISPLELLQNAPETVAEALRGARIEPLPASARPKRHWMYLVDRHLILHVYGNPNERIVRSIPEREAFQKELSLQGLPVLRIAACEPDHTWVLEDRVRGVPIEPTARGWFPDVSQWLVRLAGPPGPPLRHTAFWSSHQPGAIRAAPAGMQTEIARAWDHVGDVPTRSLHGDVQPRNLLLDGRAVGLVDWEGCWRHGLPGLDLVFLALMSARRVPDGRVVEMLARDEDPPDRPLLSPLAELGIDGARRPAALLAMLSIWSLGETRRLDRSGRRGDVAPFRSLLSRLGPRLYR
jgi:hypothetical protein